MIGSKEKQNEYDRKQIEAKRIWYKANRSEKKQSE
jgi:hypothetical protein